MDSSRNRTLNNLISFAKDLGLDVNLDTKARGHRGFFLKNRIDISKDTPDELLIATFIHEFSHYINSKLVPDIRKTTLENLFDSVDVSTIKKELIKVTNFVDENYECAILKSRKDSIKNRIKYYEKIIKEAYPNFQRSKPFKEFDKFIKRSKAKYLLKYDRVKYVSPFFRKVEYFSVDTIEKDFDMPKSFAAYIRLNSYKKKQARISAKINKLKKYYESPQELFARFVEGLYTNKERIVATAPQSYSKFKQLLNSGYYGELDKVLQISGLNIETTYLSVK